MALGIDSLTPFHGLIPPEKVRDFYRSSAYLILPSYSEGFSLVAAEAMSFGLPVIVTRSGGPEHFVDDRVGFVCPAGDPWALADAVALMLCMSPVQLAQMGEDARQRIRREYDIEQVSQRLLSLFEGLLLDMNT
jgi:glycosyltransferase involved in cell wall biosynthesis